MDYRDTISAELPPARDDEPAGLRQDILDELADHLACADNRELLRGGNAAEARRRVFDRFGDPAAVARRLWLDAMKGKIMAQRVLIATCLVMTLASLSLTGVVWRRQTALLQAEAARAAAAAAEAVRALTLQNEKAQASQQEMLKQLREMSEVMRNTRSLDWNPVRFQLTEETPEGPPGVGFWIAFNEQNGQGGPGRGVGMGGGFGAVGKGQGGPQPGPYERVTDSSGLADFGLAHPGDYSYQIAKVWDQGAVATSGQLHIEPGSQVNKRLVCPKVPPERVPVRVRWIWPADLEKERLVVFASFILTRIQRDGLSWTISDAWPGEAPASKRFPLGAVQRPSATRSVLCGPTTSLAEFLRFKQPYVWKNPEFPLRELWAEVQPSDLREIQGPAASMEWERGTYQLSGMLVLRPIESTDGQAGRRRFEVTIASAPAPVVWSPAFWVYSSPPTDAPADGPGAKGGARAKGALRGAQGGLNGEQLWQLANRGIQGESELILLAESWSKTATSFEARPSQINEWTIRLPDEVSDAIRRRLKAGADAKKAGANAKAE